MREQTFALLQKNVGRNRNRARLVKKLIDHSQEKDWSVAFKERKKKTV
jgi:hypothetical protein